jgi:hypothetical protein
MHKRCSFIMPHSTGLEEKFLFPWVDHVTHSTTPHSVQAVTVTDAFQCGKTYTPQPHFMQQNTVFIWRRGFSFGTDNYDILFLWPANERSVLHQVGSSEPLNYWVNHVAHSALQYYLCGIEQ